jgi:hypothetical protein
MTSESSQERSTMETFGLTLGREKEKRVPLPEKFFATVAQAEDWRKSFAHSKVA